MIAGFPLGRFVWFFPLYGFPLGRQGTASPSEESPGVNLGGVGWVTPSKEVHIVSDFRIFRATCKTNE